ncbi:TIGR03905 family TSCPD domain-containing protein [Segatella bryantii]|jgi:uncharacterized protein (TIGR03905 family)|uniref:ribonucleoside-diphosphate reductase n=1 Tax=Segatella bryantii TaxID=77095 RepID=A0ABX4EH17_SEGBR|nr:TIGR03905 family TSCPD domain-containing protein [Segatella bryantii]MDR4932015.1 TIGR03905 family TSCPD domain-containing protein [Segatella bryantii]OYP54389.1 TIGR03905 family protein [Segatella bryantii]UKK72047.1 TIGR03905 family TSCPD domain-containing protein [Segatella bryantii]UKK75278.1 TIGR03905 family TSCPD domain-containing protein [Segatella bryantii]UKK82596.1 TIGR03905 family TSCPD domain-containing protein [Segatella bryantii]
MEQVTFETCGTCAKAIQFELDDELCIHNVQFIGGCPGNTVGVSRMVEGLKADEVMKRLRGIHCGAKSTSCPDQLAQAIEKALAKHGIAS